jgi:L-cysteine:1D-myo-inositol 2-amino-2-deoxy-alpha-D-glucopyranoside ligase
MKLYNVLSQTSEDFAPTGDEVTIYVCGITPYDTTHLGHAFTYTAFDILIRYLEYQGHAIHYVQNVTDIDDDILRKAGEVGKDWQVLGDQWTAHFIRDMITLNVRPPDYFPRATEVIPEITRTVRRLIEAKYAYEANGSVYFDIDAWPGYGKLSRIPRAEMLPIANERGNRPDDPNKSDPLDFVLWQAQVPGEPAWESPWGLGRPGWHIECSTMATNILGNTIDIHGGGADLIFPHHESEIAQSEGATGENPFVRFWLHTAMVRHEGEKMSKSLGNLIMIRDLIKEWSADTLRLYLGSHHYREPWEYNADKLAQAHQLAQKLKAALAIRDGGGSTLDPSSARTAFEAALDNDLDTPTAQTVLSQLAGRIEEAARAGQDVTTAQQALRETAKVFGLYLDAPEPEVRVINGWKDHLKRFE